MEVQTQKLRVVKISSPINYLVRSIQLYALLITSRYNRIRPYKGAPPVGYKDEDKALVEERKPPSVMVEGKAQG